MSVTELNERFRGKAKELKEVVSSYGRKVTGNKSELINRIKMGPVTYTDEGTVMDEIVKCWFLKPLNHNKALRLGTVNEESVRKALHQFLISESIDLEVEESDPCSFG